jgi:hypothetical protein
VFTNELPEVICDNPDEVEQEHWPNYTMSCIICGNVCRKMIANGVFMSKLSCLITVWGGCEGYLIKSLQVIQNKVASLLQKMPWSTPMRTLLLQCGWLIVRQLAMYSSDMLVYKGMKAGSPEYIRGMIWDCSN